MLAEFACVKDSGRLSKFYICVGDVVSDSQLVINFNISCA